MCIGTLVVGDCTQWFCIWNEQFLCKFAPGRKTQTRVTAPSWRRLAWSPPFPTLPRPHLVPASRHRKPRLDDWNLQPRRVHSLCSSKKWHWLSVGNEMQKWGTWPDVLAFLATDTLAFRASLLGFFPFCMFFWDNRGTALREHLFLNCAVSISLKQSNQDFPCIKVLECLVRKEITPVCVLLVLLPTVERC